MNVFLEKDFGSELQFYNNLNIWVFFSFVYVKKHKCIVIGKFEVIQLFGIPAIFTSVFKIKTDAASDINRITLVFKKKKL